MSKYLSDFEYGCGGCSTCKPSYDPIDININVSCCPPDNNGDSGCCCGEGMHEALQFIEDEIPDANIQNIAIFGINSTALISDATIVNLFPYGGDITDIVSIQEGTGNIYDLSTCYIYSIEIDLQGLMDGQFEAIKNLLQETFTPENTPSCCCRTGIVRALSANIGNAIELGLNDMNSDLNDIEGSVIALSNDVVWLDTSPNENNPQLTVASLCYTISITPA